MDVLLLRMRILMDRLWNVMCRLLNNSWMCLLRELLRLYGVNRLIALICGLIVMVFYRLCLLLMVCVLLLISLLISAALTVSNLTLLVRCNILMWLWNRICGWDNRYRFELLLGVA